MVYENRQTHWGYLNGDYGELSQLTVSVLDRGFIYGDGCYEVIPAYHNSCFLLESHLERLIDNLQKIGISWSDPMDTLQTILLNLLKKANVPFASLYLQITRGTYPKREHIFPDNIRPSVFAYAMPFNPPVFETSAKGIAAITRHDIRWSRCDIKSISLLGNVLLRQEAQLAGASETLLLREGMLTEGAVSNVFIVESGVIKTPPLNQYILPGITRKAVLTLAKNLHFPCKEEPVTEEELRNADEIWVTSSTKEVTPITQLDGKIIPIDIEKSLWKTIFHAYQEKSQRGNPLYEDERGKK